jgi:aspartate carbamoyltransferase catalytic subunit
MNSKFGRPGIIEAQQFTREMIEDIFANTRQMEINPPKNLLSGKNMCILFYEPSTRTRFSFERAMKKLGGDVNVTENARVFSSAAKGETLKDTIRTLTGYEFDVLVLRYDKEGGAALAQDHSPIPIINAGDGPGQHPTQAILDLYTIQKHFDEIKGLNIAMVGDLKNGRTVRSLCYFLAKHFPDNNIYLVSPQEVRMGNDITQYLSDHGVCFRESANFYDLLPEIDILYQTRVQKERFIDNIKEFEEVERASRHLRVTTETLAMMKKNAIIMHPLPRVDEIDEKVDSDPRAIYFEQAKNGLYVRMALLAMLLTD